MDFQEHKDFCEDKKKIFRTVAIALSVFLLAATLSTLVGVSNKIKENQRMDEQSTITVSGSGDVYSKPDLGIVVFSVISEAGKIANAMKDNTEKMNAIINAMKESGTDEKDLKTLNFAIYPRYEWQKEISYYYPEGRRILVGYEISQSLQVKIRDLSKAGEIIEKAVSSGANQVGDLQFTIDDSDKLKKEAREEAIKEAKTKAKELAKQLGVRLSKITAFSESGAYPYYDFATMESSAKGVGMGGGSVPQMETGENKISVSVTITYEIR